MSIYRRHRIVLDLGGDTMDDIAQAFRQLAYQAASTGFGASGASGGPTSGWNYDYTEDPEMTHERYFEEIERWKEQRKEAKP